MKDYLRSMELKGAIKEIVHTIENIADSNPFIIDATNLEDLHDVEKMTSIKTPQGKTIIILAQDIVDMVKDFYKT